MGAGYYTVLAFMAPLTLLLCQRTGMSLILGGLAVNYGALAGANFVSSQSGIIFRGLMTSAGMPESEAFVNALAWVAHRADHHPDLAVSYGQCTVRFNTHDVNGISVSDFDCAARVDALNP